MCHVKNYQLKQECNKTSNSEVRWRRIGLFSLIQEGLHSWDDVCSSVNGLEINHVILDFSVKLEEYTPEIANVWFWAVFYDDGTRFGFFFYSVRNF